MNEIDKKAFSDAAKDWATKSAGKDLGEYFWQAALAHRDAQRGEPVFWYRPRTDDGYEGPIHNASIEECRKKSGAWVPLYTHPAPGQPAQGQQEPYLWMTEWYYDGEYEYETNHINEFSCGRKNGFPLYRHPPAAPDSDLLEALQKIVGSVPAQDGNGLFFFEHHGMDGEYLGTQYIDPIWVVQEMAGIAQAAIAKHGGAS